MAPRIESKPPSTSTGSAFSTISDSENCTPSRAPQRRPATSATKPAAVQTVRPDQRQAQADRERRELVVGDGAEGEADAGAAEEGGQHRDHRAGDRRRDEVEGGDEDAGDLERHVGDAEVEPVHLGAPEELRRALDDVGEAERRHEQGHRRAVDQRPQHGALDARSRAPPSRRAWRRAPPANGNAVLDQADEGQRREEHHRALREVEHARGLVDQHEADRDQRVHDARRAGRRPAPR